MQTINLKQYYPFCTEDTFVEVSDMPPLSVCGQTGTEREPQNRASPITHLRRERAYEHHIFRND